MAAAVKFIHCADLHLGSAFLGLGRDLPELAGRLAEAPFTAFTRIVDLALRERVDFLVIAGDIFDRDNPSLAGRMRFREELLRLDAAKIPVFLAGGNHDPVPAAWPPAVKLPGNTRLFAADAVEFFPVERNGEVIARVGGISHSRPRQTDNLTERFAALPGGPFTVGVLHANVGAQPGFQPYAPAAVADLAGKGVDYWALGHVHNFRKVNEAAPAAYYPGCPQGRAVNEPGERGCLLVQVDSAGRLSVDFHPLEAMRFEVLEVAGLVDLERFDELADRCRQAAEQFRGDAPRGPSACGGPAGAYECERGTLEDPGDRDHHDGPCKEVGRLKQQLRLVDTLADRAVGNADELGGNARLPAHGKHGLARRHEVGKDTRPDESAQPNRPPRVVDIEELDQLGIELV